MPRLSKIGAAALAAFGWTGLSTVTASYLVVAGGGSGAVSGANTNVSGGGGGAGGYLTGTTSLNSTLSYTVTVGAGAPAVFQIISVSSLNLNGAQGSSSTFNAVTATGGGYGGAYNTAGGNGGSGGGGGAFQSAGTATSGQGSNGGTGFGGGSPYPGGGGGGSSAVGANATISQAGAGGAGTANSITGTSVTYAGGGGSGGTSGGAAAGAGGSGGGGTGGAAAGNGNPGTANLGGGGGASGGQAASSVVQSSGNGGSGVVIISYPSPQKFGGGVVTTSGSNTIHTFQTSGTLSPLSTLSASYLIVAGGGSGGATSNSPFYWAGGGGGAGGLLTSSTAIDTNSIYVVTVGAGGAAPANNSTGNQGGNSSFSLVSTTAIGGGYGGYGAYPGTAPAAGNGGSGGGGGESGSGTGSAGTGTSGQGNNGSITAAGSPNFGCGGGGGAGSAASGLTGGSGTSSSISGTTTTYATGGTGFVTTAITNAAANTGNGGQGNGNGVATVSNAGGSGIVIISYAGSTQLMAGGTVTISGGNVIHTFTSSGYLAPLKLVNNSLRFRSSASAYLNRTPASTGNKKTWTYSAWVKYSVLDTGAYNQPIIWANGAGGNAGVSFEQSPNTPHHLFVYNGGNQIETTQVFRDPSAWYHIVAVIDNTQATASNRTKLYVNGIQVTALTTANYPAQNADSGLNETTEHDIGKQTGQSRYFDGYLTEINFIDGQALTPNAFGTFNSYGVWQPITYGGSYGTNGFYLPFTSNNTSSYAGSFSTTNYLTLGGVSQLALGSGNWTIEFWYYANAFTTNQVIYEGRPAGTNGTYPTLGVTGSGAINFTTNATTQIDTGANTVTLNSWNHIAFVKNGSTTTAYLNGVARGSFTDTLTYITGGVAPYIATNAFAVGSATAGINGYVSNLRVVKGTAVYTSNFTVPTSPLTNITNTALLTLQSSTIVDNSSNALTITNVGSVTSPLAYPFNTKVFADQSPQGNNWTPSAVSGVAGSTYDYMTDVPTLTSATAANYCTWNPLNKSSNHTASDGNLTATSSSYGAMAASMGFTSGKWYWELTYTNRTSTNSPVIGFGNTLFNYSNPPSGYLGSDLNAGGLNVINGNAALNAVSTAYGSAISTGDVVMFAMDLDNRKFYIGKNGTWFNSGNPVAGTNSWPYSATIVGTTFWPAVNMYTDTCSLNCGQKPYVYTPPTGFLALNTYNI